MRHTQFVSSVAWYLGITLFGSGMLQKGENMEYGMPSISIGYRLCRERNNFYIHVDWRRYIYVLILYCFASLFCLQSKFLHIH
jgi:hypothetical protein